MTHFTRTVVLFAAPAIAATIAKSQQLELAPLPVTLSVEHLQAIASLYPFAEPIPSGMPPEHAKECVRGFVRQGSWPILVEYEDGSRHWGEISRIGWESFKLLNRRTNQEASLSYAGIRRLELVDAYGAAGKFSLSKFNERRPFRMREPEPELTPEDVTYRRVAQNLGLYPHQFVRCELKNHSVVTGAIVAVGPRDFSVRPGGLHDDRVIRYRELSAPPRPTAAVGTHFQNGLEMTGMVAFCVVLLPVCMAALDDH